CFLLERDARRSASSTSIPVPAPASSNHHSAFLQFFPQEGSGLHPLLEILNRHPLVRRVGVFTRQPKPHQQHRRAKDALKVADNGNGATLTGEHRVDAERTLQGSHS